MVGICCGCCGKEACVMKLRNKFFIAGGILIVSGAVVSGAAFLAGAGQHYETAEYKTVDIAAENIRITAEQRDIRVIRGESVKLTYPEGDGMIFSGKLEGGTYIAEHRRRPEIFGLDFERTNNDMDIVLEIPEGFYGIIDIYTDMGDISCSSVSGGMITLGTGMGDVDTENTAGNMSISTGMGDISCGAVSGETVTLETDLGDIEAEDADGNISVRSSMGDVEIDLSGAEGEYTVNGKGSGPKKVTAETDLGDVHIGYMR